jgi:hypothetical protein
VINKIENIGRIIDSFGAMSLKGHIMISDPMDSLKKMIIDGIHMDRRI